MAEPITRVGGGEFIAGLAPRPVEPHLVDPGQVPEPRPVEPQPVNPGQVPEPRPIQPRPVSPPRPVDPGQVKPPCGR
jgi:hypothetical protein